MDKLKHVLPNQAPSRRPKAELPEIFEGGRGFYKKNPHWVIQFASRFARKEILCAPVAGNGSPDFPLGDGGLAKAAALGSDIRGPPVNTPGGKSSSRSTFAFSMFSDAAATKPALTTDLTDGFAALANINLDGTIAVTNFSTATSHPG